MATTSTSAKWKGKARALDYDYDYDLEYEYDSSYASASQSGAQIRRERGRGKRQRVKRDGVTVEGSGAADGVVLPLDMVGSGVYDVAYTLPVKFGSNNQQFSLQVDTGSSDLWVASTSCSTSSCKLTDGRLYDPSGSRATGVDFSIPYLQGSAAGPVVWDRVSIGGYEIDNQALAAANDVQSEPLTPKFSGILGLALPLNSIIAVSIPPVTSNAPDGAAWASNLFSITPTSLAPAARFLSLALARPGSDRVPSLLGIGRHPAALVPDPSKIAYSTLVSEASGTLFWKVGVRAITVYVGGERKAVDVGRSASGAVFPSAVVDSGVPLILTTSAIANAIYGAIGVEPAADGQYYIPCTTPLNLTFTLDTRPEIPIHPLDLTAEPPDDNQAAFCTGLIQTADAQLGSANGGIGDMILGVPFLRNVYSVMAYTQPAKDGSFAPVTSGGDSGDGGGSGGGGGGDVKPRFGLLALTDPTVALQEFNTVRVLHQPLSSSSSPSTSSSDGGTNAPNTGSDNNTKTVSTSSRKLSTGAIVGVVLLGVAVLCAVVVSVRWVMNRRDGVLGKSKRRRERERELEALGMGGARARSLSTSVSTAGEGGALSMDQKAAYAVVRGGGGGLGVSFVAMPGTPAVGEHGMLLRERECERTLWGAGGGDGKADEEKAEGWKAEQEGEFGVRRGEERWEAEGDEEEGNDDTLVGGGGGHYHDHYTRDAEREQAQARDYEDTDRDRDHAPSDSDSDSSPSLSFARPGIGIGAEHQHQQVGSVDVPLLAGSRRLHATENGDGENSRKGVNYSMPRRVGAPQDGGGAAGGADLDSS